MVIVTVKILIDLFELHCLVMCISIETISILYSNGISLIIIKLSLLYCYYLLGHIGLITKFSLNAKWHH